ncbi:hypothetical protein [Streptomyces formicae]|uniref:Holin n=1 Tax=Streptomyces formicae TaxID=1616117 RepID=A0ABY3WMC5_9ACTN|nr:hypothetical protein [Streptomyces formicae]UNM13756.1 hypothetical protein J4032_21915 [Streptomyces formicae]
MTSNLPTRGDVETVVKTAATYAKDLAERVIWTGLTASAGVAIASGPADMFTVSFWQGLGVAGIAAGGSLLKGLVARFVGSKNSASTASGV